MTFNIYYKIIYIWLAAVSFNSYAQIPELKEINDTIVSDDFGEVDDQFQELFFKALAQHGIENYDLAIESLEESLTFAPEKWVVYFQLGRNYKQLEAYDKAIKNYKKAAKERPNNQDIWRDLFEIYSRQGQVDDAIEMGRKLSHVDPEYYLDIAELEFQQQDDVAALKNLALYEEKSGMQKEGEILRQKIYRKTKNPEKLITYFERQSQDYPLAEANYKALVYLNFYHRDFEKAYQNAISLQKIASKEVEVHLGLYRHYIESGEEELALTAMKKLIKAEILHKNLRMKVIEDFTHFVKAHPQYEKDLIGVLGQALNENQRSNVEMARYYKAKDPKKALAYFEKALRDHPQDYALIKEALLLQLEHRQFENAKSLSNRALDYFPTQAFLYLAKGKAENNLNAHDKAKEDLLDGVDFVVEDEALLAEFYEALIETYSHLSDTAQTEYYKKELLTLKNKAQ